MSFKPYFKFLIAAAVLTSPVFAEESDPADKCEQAYDACLEKCEQAENGSEACYETCEKTYEKCLSQAQEEN